MVNPSMMPEIGGVNPEYSGDVAKEYNEALEQQIQETKEQLEADKNQVVSQVMYAAVNDAKVTESDYQFLNADSYDGTDFEDKTDTYVNMNTSYRYVKYNVGGAGELYNQLGDGFDYKNDSPQKVFGNLKQRFIDLGFNKVFKNGKRETVDLNSDKDFLYVIGLFQAVVEDKMDGASKKDFRIGPDTLRSLLSGIKFDIANISDKEHTSTSLVSGEVLDMKTAVLDQKIDELKNLVVKFGNDFFDLPETSTHEDFKKSIEDKIVELSVLSESVPDSDQNRMKKIKEIADSYKYLLEKINDMDKEKKNDKFDLNEAKNVVEGLSHKYLGRFFKLDKNIDKKTFKKERKEFEDNIPTLDTDEEKDSFYNAIYFGLYDLQNRFIDPKVKDKISSLREKYDPLFDKYENFYSIGNDIVDVLTDEGIFGDDLKAIEEFFNGEGINEHVDSNGKKNVVSWALLTDDADDGLPGQKTRIVSAIKKLINSGKIDVSSKKWKDFKAVMFRSRAVWSSVLDNLTKNIDKEESDISEDESLFDIASQREFEKPILDNVLNIRKKTANMESIPDDPEKKNKEVPEKMKLLESDLKEFELNKKLFTSKLYKKFLNRKEELHISLDESNLKLLAKRIGADISKIEDIISDYDSKILDNPDMSVAFLGQQQAYKDYLSKYKSLLSTANHKLLSLTAKKKVAAKQDDKELASSSVEKQDNIDLSRVLLKDLNLSKEKLLDIKKSLSNPNILERNGVRYDLNTVDGIDGLWDSGIHMKYLTVRKSNLDYLSKLK